MGPAGAPPIALQRRPIAGKGDGYVVGADVAEAEPLLRCRPALTVLYTDHCRRLCSTCFRPAAWECDRCQRFALCAACAAHPPCVAWHQSHECPPFLRIPASMRGGDTDYLRLVLRYFAALQHGPPPLPPALLAAEPAAATTPEVRSLLSRLCTNQTQQSAEFLEWATNFAKLFQRHVPFPDGFAVEDLVAFFCAVKCNSLGFPFSAEETLGWSLDPAAALFNHSCAPNCCVVMAPGGCLQVQTLRSIPAGEEATISYIDLANFASREDRRAELYDTYRFHCDCPACTA